MDYNTPAPPSTDAPCTHLLRFTSLHDRGRGVTVPCDGAGNVNMDSLSKRLLIAYLGARAMVGREYSYPKVQDAH